MARSCSPSATRSEGVDSCLRYELSKVACRPCCMATEVAILLRFCQFPLPPAARSEVVLGNVAAAQRLAAIAAQVYGYACQRHRSGKGHAVRFRARDAEALATRTRLRDCSGQHVRGVPQHLAMAPDCCRGALLRAAVLAGGRVNARGLQLSLEIACPSVEVAVAVLGAAKRAGVQGARVLDEPIVAVPGARRVAALLMVIGGGQSASLLAETAPAIPPDVGELASANAVRVRAAAARTGRRVSDALDRLGDHAPPHLAAVGRLRVEHPTLSLAALGEHLGLTKDAVAGRLRRLCQIAEAR